MSASIEIPGSQALLLPALAPALDEAVWDAWVEKGRLQDRRRGAARIKAIKWIGMAALFAAAIWSSNAPFETVIRFIVCGSAVVAMCQAIHGRHYIIASAFAALVVLFNPVIPVFSFSGDWQRVVLFASVLPFVVSFARSDARLAQDD